jgi:ABC-2 type transport system permease protein
MSNVTAILRRELGAYFDAPLAYFAVPVYAVLVGAFALWFDDLFATGLASLRGVFFWGALFLVLLVPAVTMRLLAEERRTGSLELLVTLPLRDEEIVLGKYLAAVVVVLVAVATLLPYAFVVAWLGAPTSADADAPRLLRMFTDTGLDWGPTLCGYAGLLLLGAALAAIGTAASSLTSNQIVAFLLALLLSVLPFVLGFFLESVPVGLLPLAQFVAFQPHVDNLARGVLDTRDLVFWGGLCGLALHTAVYSLERRRLG